MIVNVMLFHIDLCSKIIFFQIRRNCYVNYAWYVIESRYIISHLDLHTINANSLRIHNTLTLPCKSLFSYLANHCNTLVSLCQRYNRQSSLYIPTA